MSSIIQAEPTTSTPTVRKQIDRRTHCPAGGQQIVQNHQTLAGLDSVALNFDHVAPVLERILVTNGRPRLTALANHKRSQGRA